MPATSSASALVDLLQRADCLSHMMDAVLRSDKLDMIRDVNAVFQTAMPGNDAFSDAFKNLRDQTLRNLSEFEEKHTNYQAWLEQALRDSSKTSASSSGRVTLSTLNSLKSKVVQMRTNTRMADYSPYMPGEVVPSASAAPRFPMYGSSAPSQTAGQAAQKAVRALSFELASANILHLADASAMLASNTTTETVGNILDRALILCEEDLSARIDEERGDDSGGSGLDVKRMKRDATSFLQLSSKPTAEFSRAAGDHDFGLSYDVIGVFQRMTFGGVCSELVEPFVVYMRGVRSVIDAQVKALPGQAPGGKAPPAEVEQRRRELNNVLAAMNAAAMQLPLAAMSRRKPAALEQLVRALQAVRNGGALDAGDGKSYSWGDSGRFGLGGDGKPGGQGPLYRTTNVKRLQIYVAQIEGFLQALQGGSTPPQNASVLLGRLNTRLSELARNLAEAEAEGKSSGDPGIVPERRRRLVTLKMEAGVDACRQIKRITARFVAGIVAFLTTQHRDACGYVAYWDRMRPLLAGKDDVLDLLARHKSAQMEIRDFSSGVLKKLAESVAQVRTDMGRDDGGLQLDANSADDMDQHCDKLTMWLQNQDLKVRYIIEQGGSRSLGDALSDPTMVLIYALKALRLLAAWYALRVAARTFQGLYDRRVYGRDEAPPHPAVFVGMTLAVELAIQLGVMVVLLFSQQILKQMDVNVSSAVVSAWVLDYGLSTAVVAVLALVIGEVVRKKKYFRYRYEGDRGIRAMQQMMMYTYGVVLLIPFFRLTYS